MKTKYKEADLPEYETPDKIPTYEQIVPPINMDGLPKYNLVRKFMDNLSETSDTYPEYAMQGGFTALSIITRRRLHTKLNGSEIYPILWNIVLGPSGYARKTVALKRTRKVLSLAVGKEAILPDDVTPQALIDRMATKTLIRSSANDCSGWFDVSEKYADKECRIPRSQRGYIRDEVSQMFAQMRNSGSSWLQELFLKLYSGEDYDKALVNKIQIVEEPFFSMLISTTPESFKKHMTKENLRSGFLARQLVTNPEYEKTRKPLQEDSENNAQVMQDLINEFKLLDSLIGDNDTSIRAGFQDGVLEMLDKWVEERETYYRKMRDEDHLIYIPRYQESAVSMALLIELGNIPHIVKKENIIGENINFMLTSLRISKASMGFALKLIDSVFSPYHDTLGLRDESQRFEKGNLAKVEKLLKYHRKLDYSTIQRNTGIPAKQLHDIIETMLEAGMIEKCYAKKDGSRQKGLWLIYIPAFTNKFVFETDYSKIQIEEYTPEMIFEPKQDLTPDSLEEKAD